VIVNLLDAKLAQPNPDFFTYTVSKMGLAGLTELTARAYAARGIRVCAIAPSVTLVSGPQSRDNFDKVHKMNALGRGVDVEEIVRALRFILATPTYTGQTITLDGGQRFCRCRATSNSWSRNMNEFSRIDASFAGRCVRRTRKVVLEDYQLPVDIGFHDFEVGRPSG
jgi:hypothetical protein